MAVNHQFKKSPVPYLLILVGLYGFLDRLSNIRNAIEMTKETARTFERMNHPISFGNSLNSLNIIDAYASGFIINLSFGLVIFGLLVLSFENSKYASVYRILKMLGVVFLALAILLFLAGIFIWGPPIYSFKIR